MVGLHEKSSSKFPGVILVQGWTLPADIGPSILHL